MKESELEVIARVTVCKDCEALLAEHYILLPVKRESTRLVKCECCPKKGKNFNRFRVCRKWSEPYT